LTVPPFPLPLSSYPPPADRIWQTLATRAAAEPFNLVATAIFALAVLHTFGAARFTALSHTLQRRHDARLMARGLACCPSVVAELLHFLGEVEVVFGLWAVVLMVAIALRFGWTTATHYLNDTVHYGPALFVVVIMALSSTRPIVLLAERVMGGLARLGRGTPGAWWCVILTVGPLFGSLITEPAAMTVCALLLARQLFACGPGQRLKYATLGLLFVNVSIGGTLTHFAAPPVLMAAREWGWGTPFMFVTFGWRAVIAIALSTTVYYAVFRREFAALSRRVPVADREQADEEAPLAGGQSVLPSVPAWLTLVHLAFVAWTVVNEAYPALFLGGFLFFLGFARATAAYQTRLELRTPLLVGFFLGGLVIHGGLQAWWIAPLLGGVGEQPLFAGAALMTAFNDNALITFLATLVPHLSDTLKVAVVGGAVVGGGLTVIANAPNPAGQALLSRFFDGSVSPLYLLFGAAAPTLISAAVFMLL
jgi:hypothetical protein